MDKAIIVLHGYNSKGGQKAKDLQKALPDYKVFNPLLTSSVEDNVQTIYNLLLSVSEKYKELHVVGTSLGGFYALDLCRRIKPVNDVDIYYYVINPALTPTQTLPRIGEVSQQDYETLSEMESLLDVNDLLGVTFFIGLRDTVIPPSHLLETLQKKVDKPYNLVVSDQDHRHSDLTSVIDLIKTHSSIAV